MLFNKGKITQDMIALLDRWRHTGFNVYCGPRIIPCLPQPETTDIQFRKTGSRLIQKIYEVDPLTCLKCQAKMRVVAFIEDPDVVKKILRHLNLWEFRRPPRPVAHASPMIQTPAYDDIPQPSPEDFIADPVYPLDACF